MFTKRQMGVRAGMMGACRTNRSSSQLSHPLSVARRISRQKVCALAHTRAERDRRQAIIFGQSLIAYALSAHPQRSVFFYTIVNEISYRIKKETLIFRPPLAFNQRGENPALSDPFCFSSWFAGNGTKAGSGSYKTAPYYRSYIWSDKK